MGSHSVCHKDIALMLHVTQSTVSRALDENPAKYEVVKKETRDLILRTARELGYRPNRQASFLKRGRNATILCFLPDVSYTLTADLMFGISEAAGRENFPVDFLSCSSPEDFHHLLQSAMRGGNTGVLSFPPQKMSSQLYKDMRDYVSGGGRILFLNVVSNTPGYGEVPEEFSDVVQVNIDDDYGGELVARHFLDCGCRRFIYLADGHMYLSRRRGYIRYLEERGIHVEERDVLDWESLKRCSERTGIFAVHDIVALHVALQAAKHGMELGARLLLCGYDDLFHCRKLGLTSVHQPMRDMGRRSVKKLIQMILGREETGEAIRPSLIIRESTGGSSGQDREEILI